MRAPVWLLGPALDVLFSLPIQKTPNPLPPTFHELKSVLFRFVSCKCGPARILSTSFNHLIPAFILRCRLCPLGGRSEPLVLSLGLRLRISPELWGNKYPKVEGKEADLTHAFLTRLKYGVESSKRQNTGRNSGSIFKQTQVHGSNVQHRDCSSQYYIVYLIFVKSGH